jgi:nucleotide-binding universal stress UspA family protein
LDRVQRSFLAVSTATDSTGTKFRSEIFEDSFSDVANALIHYAESDNVDLIVIGTRGRSGFRRMIIGSF